ncbi:YdcF family protein [Allobaculum mucilyticum]|uniref:YdcF family protein n=1 Tax=Allobaculum mucilyticum TaxID=2834459 RepID=UPI001E628478|nr:YdcF family protein [Allobaculum mucilyticum]UNT95704.1 YdcF family protein [Allobaculum mucilyticum]
MISFILALPAIIGFVLLAIVRLVEPRSLWSGAALLIFICGCGLSAIFFLFRYSYQLQQHAPWFIVLLGLVAVAAIVILVSFPLLLAALFFVEGIRLIRREGYSLSNCLSLAFSFCILTAVFLLPVLVDRSGSSLVAFLVGMLWVVIGYLSFLLGMYVLSSWMNLIHFQSKNRYNLIVVLGSGLLGATVPPLLAGRIEEGIRLQKKNSGSVLILSGGQGPGEDVPEGAAMKAWALSHGADPENTISEEKSKNTLENLMFSRTLFPYEEQKGKIAIVTTLYHVFRALLLGRSIGLPCVGYGSKTKWYFTLNAMLREFAAYLSETKKRQIRNLILICLPFLFVGLLSLFLG